MKKIYLLLLSIIIANISFSQANVTSSGISIQGIARDVDNVTALPNQSVSIKVDLFYFNANNVETIFLTRTGNITTDAFGIFTYVVSINATEYAKIANYNSYVRISSGNTVYVQEKLKSVPYAVHAQNGVPTGAIMPFGGSTVPAGWLLADGSAIDASYTALKAIYGNNLPDLRGIYLRGTGTQPGYNGQYVGPAVRSIQEDAVQSHAHNFTYSGTTNTTGAHTHAVAYSWGGAIHIPWAYASNQIEASSGGALNSNDMWIGSYFSSAGDHTHTYNLTNQSISSYGGNETIAPNYGINYIIKI